MIRAIVCFAVIAVVYGATTVSVSAPQILYDMAHHKAMIVKADGCYEYHMNHQDVVDSEDPSAQATLEARMLAELAMAVNIQETGHNHINHMSQDIQTACASLPVYSWDLPSTTVMATAV